MDDVVESLELQVMYIINMTKHKKFILMCITLRAWHMGHGLQSILCIINLHEHWILAIKSVISCEFGLRIDCPNCFYFGVHVVSEGASLAVWFGVLITIDVILLSNQRVFCWCFLSLDSLRLVVPHDYVTT